MADRSISADPLGQSLFAAARADGIRIPIARPRHHDNSAFQDIDRRTVVLLCEEIEHPADEIYRIIFWSY
jgi:hypothetical protein